MSMRDSRIYNDEEFSLIAGSFTVLEFNLKDIYGKDLDNVALDSVKWRMAKYGDFETIIEKNTSNGIDIIENVIVVKLDSSDTQDCSGLFHHQLILNDIIGNQFAINEGKIIITKMIK